MNAIRTASASLLLVLSVVGCETSSTEPRAEAPRDAAPRDTAPRDAAPSATAPLPAASSPADSETAAPVPTEIPVHRSPEAFARSMTGTIGCGKGKCRAGKQVCVVTPSGEPARCEDIQKWVQHRTPEPSGGFPNMVGITACQSSQNCPSGSFCCLHEIGMADVQAVVCHASVDECRDRVEVCTGEAKGECRTPGTKCIDRECRAK